MTYEFVEFLLWGFENLCKWLWKNKLWVLFFSLMGLVIYNLSGDAGVTLILVLEISAIIAVIKVWYEAWKEEKRKVTKP